MTETSPLRDQLADALRAETYPYGHGDVHGDVLDVADAVLPVVEAETAALRQRAEQAERQRDEALAAAERVRHLCAQMRSHPYTRHAANRIEATLDQPEST